MNDLAGLVQQCFRDSKRWFPDKAQDLGFLGLALGGETGELQNLIKKYLRDDIPLDEIRADMSEEAVDVLIYLCNIFAILGVDPVKVYAIKRAKNERRFGKGHHDADARVGGS